MDHITIKPFCDIGEFKTLSPGQIISKVQRRTDNSKLNRIQIMEKTREDSSSTSSEGPRVICTKENERTEYEGFDWDTALKVNRYYVAYYA